MVMCWTGARGWCVPTRVCLYYRCCRFGLGREAGWAGSIYVPSTSCADLCISTAQTKIGQTARRTLRWVGCTYTFSILFHTTDDVPL